jgi:hypothetical protein
VTKYNKRRKREMRRNDSINGSEGRKDVDEKNEKILWLKNDGN